MKRLLVFTENYFRGGGNRYLVDTVNAVAGLFDEVVIAGNPGSLFPEDKARLQVNYVFKGVPILTKSRLMWAARRSPKPVKLAMFLVGLLLAPVLNLYDLVLCLRLIRRFSPSVVLSCNGGYPGGQSTLMMVVAARCLNITALLSVVSVPMPRSRIGLYGRIADNLVCWASKLIIVNAEAVAEGLRGRRGFPADKIRVVHNGLEDRTHLRQETEGELQVGCVTRLEKGKGVQYLLEAFASLVNEYPMLKLVLVGDGPAAATLAGQVSELAINGRVDMVGFYDGDISDILAGVDIYAFPSLHEGFPYSILEAMRAGCAIIATAVGGVPEAVRSEQEGLLVEPASAPSLAVAIRRLCSDQALRWRLGSGARERFVRDFSLETMGDRLREIFSTVIGDQELVGSVKYDKGLSS